MYFYETSLTIRNNLSKSSFRETVTNRAASHKTHNMKIISYINSAVEINPQSYIDAHADMYLIL